MMLIFERLGSDKRQYHVCVKTIITNFARTNESELSSILLIESGVTSELFPQAADKMIVDN